MKYVTRRVARGPSRKLVVVAMESLSSAPRQKQTTSIEGMISKGIPGTWPDQAVRVSLVNAVWSVPYRIATSSPNRTPTQHANGKVGAQTG
jgi:hypothetical protein